jgi:hypothetical protein
MNEWLLERENRGTAGDKMRGKQKDDRVSGDIP